MRPFSPLESFEGMLTWRPTPWGQPRVFVGTGKSADDAVARCREEAVRAGWRPPRWWQWWRRREPKHPLVRFSAA